MVRTFERMKEMTMLDLSEVDLGDLVMALEDHSEFGRSWWIDADTGEVWMWSPDVDDDGDEFDPDGRADARRIDPLPSRVGYADMEDFIAGVGDRRAAELLGRAIAGRGAFRRFKDTLFEFPELRERWFVFSDTRMRRRAIEFLLDEGLIDEAEGQRALEGLDDPPMDGAEDNVDPQRLAEGVVHDLRGLYGDRLVAVVLFGSHARGDSHPDSDIDLAVILDRVHSPWDELRRMDEVLWRHTLESGVTISATAVSRSAWDQAQRPLLRTAKAEGRRVS